MNYYGVQITDRMIHVSPQCPALKKIKSKSEGIVSCYGSEADAVIDGHRKRCAVCFNMLMFHIKINDEVKHFLLTRDHANIMLMMANRAGGEESSVPGTAAAMGMSKDLTNFHLKRLINLGLVESASVGYQGAHRRRPTKWGHALAIAFALDIYGIHSEVLNYKAEQAGEYKRIA